VSQAFPPRILLELLVHGVEGLAEALAAGAVDPPDRVAQLGEAALEIDALLVEEAEALAQLLVLLDRAEVHVAQRLEAALHLFQAGATRLQIEGEHGRDLLGLAARIPCLSRLLVGGNHSRFAALFRAGLGATHSRLLVDVDRGRFALRLDRRERRLPEGQLDAPALPDAGLQVVSAQLELAQRELCLARLVAARLELDTHLTRRVLRLAHRCGERLPGVALLLAALARGLFLTKPLGEMLLGFDQRARQLLAACLAGCDLGLTAADPVARLTGLGAQPFEARAHPLAGFAAARLLDAPLGRHRFETRALAAGRADPEAQCVERLLPGHPLFA
jgi:hypothetical protein